MVYFHFTVLKVYLTFTLKNQQQLQQTHQQQQQQQPVNMTINQSPAAVTQLQTTPAAVTAVSAAATNQTPKVVAAKTARKRKSIAKVPGMLSCEIYNF